MQDSQHHNYSYYIDSVCFFLAGSCWQQLQAGGPLFKAAGEKD
jgi:hypothetical protein